MTTTDKMFVGCRVCGNASPQFGIAGTSAYGYADLEGAPESAGTLVESAHYRAQLHDEDFPELANSFLCSAMLLRYQRSLLLKADRSRYTVEAALGAGR